MKQAHKHETSNSVETLSLRLIDDSSSLQWQKVVSPCTCFIIKPARK